MPGCRIALVAVLFAAVALVAAPWALSATDFLTHQGHAAYLAAPFLIGAVSVVAPSMADLAEKIAARMADYSSNPDHPDLVGHPEGNPVQIRPAFPDAADFTKRLTEGVAAKAAHYAEGVRRPRANFLDRAKASTAAWAAGVNAAVAGNRHAAGLNKVNADEAIETAATLGAATYVQGVQGRMAKIQRVLAEVAPTMAAAVSTVRGLPKTTDAHRANRAIPMIRPAP